MVAPEELLTVQRQRVHDLVSVLDERRLRAPVPACPGWTVQDVVAHLVGSAADLVRGEVDGTGTDARNARHVGERQAATVGQMWDEWEQHAAVLESSSDTWAPVGIWLLYDVVIHEDDLREAILAVPADDSPAYGELLEGLVSTADRALRHAGVQALRMTSVATSA